MRAFSYANLVRLGLAGYFAVMVTGCPRNWAAKVTVPGIEGFYIQPNYPTDGPLYSPAGGWVVMDYVDDPYAADPTDVWLVQEALFESTYEVTE
jgi:hypothetical protein